MTNPQSLVDPKLDMVLERLVDVPREMLWEAWTKPEHVSQWFTPKPWTISQCEIDLRPGGVLRTVMRSPEGQESKGDKTRHVATVLHRDEASRHKHQQMGFYEGWGAALEQLISHAKTISR